MSDQRWLITHGWKRKGTNNSHNFYHEIYTGDIACLIKIWHQQPEDHWLVSAIPYDGDMEDGEI